MKTTKIISIYIICFLLMDLALFIVGDLSNWVKCLVDSTRITVGFFAVCVIGHVLVVATTKSRAK